MEFTFIQEEGTAPLCAYMDKVYPLQLPPLSSSWLSPDLPLQGIMRKRRQSLQALFIPPFFQSSATSRSRSHSETGQGQPVPINSPTIQTTTTTSQDSPPLDPFSQALYSFASTDNVVSVDSPYSDLLDTDPFANLSTPPRSPTNQDKPLPNLPSLLGVLPAPTLPRSPLSPAEHRAHPLPSAGIKYTSATTPSSPVSSVFHISSPARPAYTRPVFKSTPSLPSLRALSQGQYIPTRKIRKGRVGATLPVEPWNQIERPDPLLEESWLSSLDGPHQLEHSPPLHDDNVTIYSGGFNDSTENLISSTNAPVQPDVDYRGPTSLPSHPADTSFLSAWDDSLSSLSSFTAESESDFQIPTSPTWSSFSRRSSGECIPSSTSDVFNSIIDPSPSNHNSSTSLSDEDLALLPSPDDSQIHAPLVLPVPVDFHPGTSAETIRPSPSQLMELRLSERLSSGGSFEQRSYASSRSSSIISQSRTRPASPDPSECSYLSTEESDGWDDEDGISYDRDVELEDDQVDDDDHQGIPKTEVVYNWDNLVTDGPCVDDAKGDLSPICSGEPEDGEGSSGGNYDGGRYTSAGPSGYGYGSMGSRPPGTHRSAGGTSGSGGGRDGDGRRPFQPSMPLHGTEEGEDTDSADEHGEDDPSPNRGQPIAPSKKRSSDEDDVPLARSIPTALKAQKTIRKKVREENAQRRQERAARLQAKMQNISGVPQSAGPTTTVFQHEETPPRDQIKTTGRSRTQTLPSSSATPRSPFAVDDLTKKLMDVQASMTGSDSQEPIRSGARPSHQRTQEPSPSSKSRRPSQDLPRSLPPSSPNAIHEAFQKSTLRPTRSFHRPARALQPDTNEPLPNLGLGDTSLAPSRSIRRPRTGDPTTGPSPTSAFSGFPLQRSRSTRQQSKTRPQDEDYGPPGRSLLTRPSPEVSVDSRAHWSEKAAALPPVPPIPTYDMLMKQKSGETWQQKVYLGDMQRSTVVEVGATTSAQGIIDAIESRGETGPSDPHNNGGKGWMLFELAQDFGMERPIRCFELLADIKASWSKGKTVNYILLKRTALSSRLSVEALPATSPTYRGYLECEVKRGKWSKRWMELRDGGLWLSKRDTGKDEVFLCKLTNFDVYSVTRVMKTPKPFVFAVKSTDNLSLFENTADYLHTFCCKEKEGLEWMMNILLARSCVSYRGRQPQVGASLSRAGTRRAQNKPGQTLVSIPPSTAQTVPAKAVFEPGSLLATRMM